MHLSTDYKRIDFDTIKTDALNSVLIVGCPLSCYDKEQE